MNLNRVWISRPVLWLLFAFAAGIALSQVISANTVIVFLIMSAILITTLFIWRRHGFLPVLAILLLFGIIRGNIASGNINPIKSFDNTEVIIVGKVVGIPQYSDKRDIYTIETVSIEPAFNNSLKIKEGDSGLFKVKTRLQLSVYHDKNSYSNNDTNSGSIGNNSKKTFKPGDVIKVNGIVKEPIGQRNPKGFDYKAYLLRKNIQNIISVKPANVELIEKGRALNLARILSGIRDKSLELINNAVGGEEGDLLSGMLLGTRWLIPEEIGDNFAKAGLAHILAISGLHVGFLIILIVKLTDILSLNKVATFIIQLIFMILFCTLVGASPSAVRAVIMSVIYLLGKALGRRSDVLNSMGVAAFLMLLFNPLILFDVGFQLSFVTVSSIALLYKPINRLLERLPYMPSAISTPLSVTLAAQLGALPLIVYYFNNISIISLFANLIAVPLSGLIITAGFILLTMGLLIPFDISFLGFIIKLPCSVLIKLSSVASVFPLSNINMISPPIAMIFAYFLIVWFISDERPHFIKKPGKWVGSIVCITVILTLFIVLIKPTPLKVVFLDVGQGDCTYIRTPDRKHILIDTGGNELNPEKSQTGKDIITPFLLKHGVSKLDLVVISHSHGDHIGGMSYLLDNIRIDALMLYPPEKESSMYEEMIEKVQAKNIKVFVPIGGDTYRIGKNTRINILYPPDDENLLHALASGNENNRSIVMEFQYEDTNILFTGDIESVVERHLSRETDIKTDILKVPHHGSSTSSTEEFIGAANPYVAVFQVGQNFFGHPSQNVIDRYEYNGTYIYRNDEHGAVICNYMDGRWVIDTMLQPSH